MRVFLFLMFVSATGCSFLDDPDADEMTRDVAALPPSSLVQARRWLASQRGRQYLERQPDPRERFMTVLCGPAAGRNGGPIITVGDMLRCMKGAGDPLYVECIRSFVDEANEAMRASGDPEDCKPRFEPGWRGKTDSVPWLNPEWIADGEGEPTELEVDERRVLSREVVIELLKATAPPTWYSALLAVAAGAGLPVAVGLLPKLCAQAGPGHWSCPSSPLYPPGQTPQPGGDH